MGATVHAITDNLDHATLHTVKNLAEALLAVLQDWNLDPDILSCAKVDNATDVQKAENRVYFWNSLGSFGHNKFMC